MMLVTLFCDVIFLTVEVSPGIQQKTINVIKQETVIQFLDYSAFWWNSTTRPSTKLKRHPRSGRQELLGLVQDSTSSCGRSCQLTVIFTDEAMIFRPRAQLLQCQLPGTLMRPCCAKKVPQMRDILVEPCKPDSTTAPVTLCCPGCCVQKASLLTNAATFLLQHSAWCHWIGSCYNLVRSML